MRWRGPVADDLVFRLRLEVGGRLLRLVPGHRLVAPPEAVAWTTWHVKRREVGGELRAAFQLDGWYRLMCKLGLHFLHDDFIVDRWICCCGRNYINNEELPR